MKKKFYPRFQETVYQDKLDNGLEVILFPKKEFTKTYVTLATRFGALDNHFIDAKGIEHQVPNGIAHFLEHKVFEDRHNTFFNRFASQGATCNAYTNFERTVYLFTTTEQVKANLKTLLDGVQSPYFTDKNIAKEKGIIIQEIAMYQDNPQWCLFRGLVHAMYEKHPIHIDILGSEASIQTITKEMLSACYDTFYHPSNMTLFIFGKVHPDDVWEWINENQAQKKFSPPTEIKRFLPQEPTAVRTQLHEVQLAVAQPKCLFGFKEKLDPKRSTPGLIQRDLLTNLALESILGPSSELYLRLYQNNLVSPDFGYEYVAGNGYAFSAIGGETSAPEELKTKIARALEQASAKGIEYHVFERVRRTKIGSFLRKMDEMESLGNAYMHSYFKGGDFLKTIELYEKITLDELNQRLREHVQSEQLATAIIRGSS